MYFIKFQKTVILITFLLGHSLVFSQNISNEIIKRNYYEKEPLYLFGTWLLITNQILQTNIDELKETDLDKFSKYDINKLDRGATNYYNLDRARISDVLMYSSISLPLTLIGASKKRNQLKEVSAMFLEVGTLTASITRITKSVTQRVRPFVYNPDAPISEKLDLNAKRSFISGHTSIAAAYSFFWARILTGNTNNKIKKIGIWSLAITLPATTGLFRYNSGKHFPTDIIAGYLIGGSIGYFIPSFHMHLSKKKTKKVELETGINSICLKMKI